MTTSDIHRHIKQTALLTLHSLLLLLVTYCVWNIPYDLTGAGALLQKYHLLSSVIASPDHNGSQDELLLVNTSYDRILVEKHDSQTGEVRGNIDITDRHKLLRLMQALKEAGDYRYIVCDIQIFNEYVTSSDSALWATIASMPHIVIPSIGQPGYLPNELQCIACTSEYGVTYDNTNFLKYQLLSSDSETIPLRMARELNGIDYEPHLGGLYYTLDNALCINAPIVDIAVNCKQHYNDDGELVINDLGNDLLPLLDFGIDGIFTDRIVIIADFMENDMHDTVAGSVSGPMILYNTYRMLTDHRNCVSVWLLLALFLAYTILTLATIRNWTLSSLTRKIWPEMPLLVEWLTDWLGIEVILVIICIATVFSTSLYIDIWVQGGYFFMLGKIIELSRIRKKR